MSVHESLSWRKMMTYLYLLLLSVYSHRHQTFHDTPIGPQEGQEGVGATNSAGAGGGRVRYAQT